jgi:DNA primase
MWNVKGVRRVLYGLPTLRSQTELYIVEGEKDVLALGGVGVIATTNPGGASNNPDKPKWRAEYTQQLVEAGVKSVVILPDNDAPGRGHAEAAANGCHAAGMMVKIVELPGLPPKGDVSDWLDAGHTRTDLIEIVAATPNYRSTSAEPDTAEAADTQQDPAARASDEAPPKKESQATAIVRLAQRASSCSTRPATNPT